MKAVKLIAVLGICALVLMACPSDDDDTKEKPIGNGTAVGLGDGYARSLDYTVEHGGAGYGRKIEVTVTVAGGELTFFDINGPDESPEPGRGQDFIESAKLVIDAKDKTDLENIFNFSFDEVDSTSGASLTYRGILQAGKDAFNQLRK